MDWALDKLVRYRMCALSLSETLTRLFSLDRMHTSPPYPRSTEQLVNFGVEILKLIPGRVSTEVDARYVPVGYPRCT